MRNRFIGICYRCGFFVAPGQGHFERYLGKWRTLHADCCIINKELNKLALIVAEELGASRG